MTPEEQKSFKKKIKEIFDNLIEWVNNLLAQYKSGSAEAKALREYKEELVKISKMWDEMFANAVKSNQILQKEGIVGEQVSSTTQKNIAQRKG